MLERMVRSGSSRPVWYIHGAENGRVHAMGAHVRELAAQACNVTVYTFYNVPDPGDQAGRDYDGRGLLTGNRLARNAPIEQAVYCVCGPWSFLRGMVGCLASFSGEESAFSLVKGCRQIGAYCGLSSQPVTM